MTLKRLLVFLPILVSIADAQSIPASDKPASKFLTFPVERVLKTATRTRRALEKSETTLFNITGATYMVELSIGTPMQTVRVALDTGSSELWVNPDCSDPTLDVSSQASCLSLGFYNQSLSSSAKPLNQTTTIQYGGGNATVAYVADNVTIAGTALSVNHTQFGVATNSSQQGQGVMGLSFGNGHGGLTYNTFLDNLQQQNVTNVKAFSMALGDLYTNNGGMVVFGGVDTKKFTGALHHIPLIYSGPDSSNNTAYWVQLDSLGLTKPGQVPKTYDNSSTVVLLDTGSETSALPSAVLNQLAADMNATWSAFNELYMVDCAAIELPGTVDFTFAGMTIKIPYKQFIWEFQPGLCGLGAERSEGADYPIHILGTYFLRAAYIVYDQSTPAIWIAPYESCGQNVEEIPVTGVGSANFTGHC